MEVPFSLSGTRADKHLDAYLFNDKYAIFLECKIVWAESHIKAIGEDMARIPNADMIAEVQQRHNRVNCPIPFGVVLLETWRDYVADWRVGESSDTRVKKWTRDRLPTDWNYGFIEVHKEHDEFEGTLFWLYAVSPDLRGSSSVTSIEWNVRSG